ncbi:MAG: FeoB-associated Cys-rich membrane protein [Myxococcales bacterium]|jgi:hypothetical protein|nr:FeoB-associated Cys-rich membrane protein [Myxococcales bacterium]
METLIVAVIVALAATFFGFTLFRKIRRLGASGRCGGCDGCGNSKCPSSKSSGDSASGSSRQADVEGTRGACRLSPVAPTMAALALCSLVAVTPARAADTVEVYASGEVSFETHFGMEGIRDGRASMAIGNQSVLGVGITKHLAGFVGFSFETDGYLDGAGSAFEFGLISTVLDGDLFDLDLMLTFDGGIAPGLELNLDLPANFGVYLRAALPLFGITRTNNDNNGDGAPSEVGIGLDLTPGLYWTVREGHQLLVEASAALLWSDEEDAQGRLDLWSVALGYNVMLLDNLELVTEARLFKPNGGEVEFGFGLGFIASLPSSS